MFSNHHNNNQNCIIKKTKFHSNTKSHRFLLFYCCSKLIYVQIILFSLYKTIKSKDSTTLKFVYHRVRTVFTFPKKKNIFK